MNSDALLEFIASLERQGVKFTPLPGGRLRIEAPRGLLTPELKELITQHKSQILEFLSNPMIYCGGKTVKVYRARLECAEAGGCLYFIECELFYLTWAPGWCRERVPISRPKSGRR